MQHDLTVQRAEEVVVRNSGMNQDSVGGSRNLSGENVRQYQSCVTLTAEY